MLIFDDYYLFKFGQLEKKLLVDFFKCLRYYYGLFCYVVCGEYGEFYWCFYYYVVLFGMDFFLDWLFYKELMCGEFLYISFFLFRVWIVGNVFFGVLIFESVVYIV